MPPPQTSPLRLTWLLLLAFGAGCAATRQGPPVRTLSTEEIAQLIPQRVKDRAGWAEDVAFVFEAQGRAADVTSVCSVLAVVEQESGFDANPAVPDLSRMVASRLEAQAEKLGPLGPPLARELLSGKAPGEKRTFEQRLGQVRTERDLDRVFRDLLHFHRAQHPKTYAAVDLASGLFGKGRLEALNPITTAGSMQVSVRFARELASAEGRELTDEEVREELYTRRGGLRYGAARLLGYEAAYAEPVFRFADYNAGVYASRNAALQRALTELTGAPLVTDGDLLAYDAEGDATSTRTKSLEALEAFRQRFAPDLSERRVRGDVRREKERGLEETDTYRAIADAYAQRKGRPLPYAVLPEVTLQSPKLRGKRTTRWFAESVQARYVRCLEGAQRGERLALRRVND